MYYSVQREVDRLLDDSLREVALSFDNIRSQDVVQLKRRFGNREQRCCRAKFMIRSAEPLPCPDGWNPAGNGPEWAFLTSSSTARLGVPIRS